MRSHRLALRTSNTGMYFSAPPQRERRTTANQQPTIAPTQKSARATIF
jgi:hypothetical protein